MTSNLERLKADLRSIPGDWRVLCWSGWDQPYPPEANFREYLFRADELLAALDGDVPPARRVIRVRVNTSVGLRIRSTPDTSSDANIVGKFADKTEVTVFEDQTNGFYEVAEGEHKGRWIAAQYVVRVL